MYAKLTAAAYLAVQLLVSTWVTVHFIRRASREEDQAFIGLATLTSLPAVASIAIFCWALFNSMKRRRTKSSISNTSSSEWTGVTALSHENARVLAWTLGIGALADVVFIARRFEDWSLSTKAIFVTLGIVSFLLAIWFWRVSARSKESRS